MQQHFNMEIKQSINRLINCGLINQSINWLIKWLLGNGVFFYVYISHSLLFDSVLVYYFITCISAPMIIERYRKDIIKLL